MFLNRAQGREDDGGISLPLFEHVKRAEEGRREEEANAREEEGQARALREQAAGCVQPWERVRRVTLVRRAEGLEAQAEKRRGARANLEAAMAEYRREWHELHTDSEV